MENGGRDPLARGWALTWNQQLSSLPSKGPLGVWIMGLWAQVPSKPLELRPVVSGFEVSPLPGSALLGCHLSGNL